MVTCCSDFSATDILQCMFHVKQRWSFMKYQILWKQKWKVFIEQVAMGIQLNLDNTIRGGSRISVSGIYMYKDVGYAFADFISFFLNISHENEMIWSHFFVIWYFKTADREGVQANPLNPKTIRHWICGHFVSCKILTKPQRYYML